MKFIDLTGKRFYRLFVESKNRTTNKRTYWNCLCDCGSKKVVEGEPLKSGRTKSCGCLATELLRKRSITHGESIGRKESKELKSRNGAKGRCYNPNNKKYHIYGKRGIRMCDRWLNNFENFLTDMGRCPPGKTLDRIDVNGNYEPSNCAWATRIEQGKHIRNNVFMEYNGKIMIQKDWSRLLGIDNRTLNHLYKRRGMNIADIISYKHIQDVP